MKLAFFDDYKLGVVKGDTIVDVSAAVRDIPHLGPHDLINGLIARFGDYSKRLEDAAASGKGVPLSSVKLQRAAAEARQHRLHGGELHGERHAQGAGADQRLPQGADRDPRPGRAPWCCPTCRPRSSRARPRWRW